MRVLAEMITPAVLRIQLGSTLQALPLLLSRLQPLQVALCIRDLVGLHLQVHPRRLVLKLPWILDAVTALLSSSRESLLDLPG